MSETHWAGKNVPQMWASAQAADTQTAWQQVNAWRRTHDLLLHHAGRLKACADELAYAWPPGRSPAAQAFTAYINELRAAILQASADAATNYTAIAGVLTSLSAAKADMAQLKQDWDAYEGAPTAEKAARSLSGGSDSPEALNVRARVRMAQNDQEVLESSRRLVELPPWARPYSVKEPKATTSQGGDGSGVAPLPRAAGSRPTSWMTAPSIDPIDLTDGQIGLAGSSVASKPAGAADPLAPTAMPGAPSTHGSLLPNPDIGTVGRPPVARTPSAGEPDRFTQSGGFRGGQVGGMGGATSASPLAVGAGRGQGRVNPVGGVIEANRPATSASALPFMGGARGSAESRQDSTAALTMCWEVREGVNPVIEPAAEQPFELGPGVIGIDR